MDKNTNFLIAVDIVNRKIAEMNIILLSSKSKKNNEELSKWLNYRKEIYNGNNELIEKISNGDIV